MSEKDKYCMIALNMWILKNNIKEIYIYTHTHTHTHTDTESKPVVAKEEREESRDK